MRILICGDRYWADASAIERELLKVIVGVDISTITIIHGCASGADCLGGMVAKRLGLKVDEYPADWKQFGRRAGPIRNSQMLNEGKPDLVLAFHPNIELSRGTGHMVLISRKAGVEVRVFDR